MNHTKWLRELCEKRLRYRSRSKPFAEDYVYFDRDLTTSLAEVLLEVLDYADSHPRRFPIETAPDNTPVLVWLPGIQRAYLGIRDVRPGLLAMWVNESTGRMLAPQPTHWAPIPGEDE